MTLHEKAENGLLKGEELTAEMLNEPPEATPNTVIAAWSNTLKDIPQDLFTEEALNSKDKIGRTIWHTAAKYGTLKEIPKHLFTKEAFYQKDKYGYTVWRNLKSGKTLSAVPHNLITSNLLDIKDKGMKPVFNEIDIDYINEVLQIPEKLNNFIKANPTMAKDIEHRDPRYVINEVLANGLSLEFEWVKDKITLRKDGSVSIGENLCDSLKEATKIK